MARRKPMAGRRKSTEPDPNQELPHMPPSDRIWPDYAGVPIERVDVAFGGFKATDRRLATALETIGSEQVVSLRMKVQNHKYVTKYDADFGDVRGRVVVTLIPVAMTLEGGGDPIVIDGEVPADPEEGE